MKKLKFNENNYFSSTDAKLHDVGFFCDVFFFFLLIKKKLFSVFFLFLYFIKLTTN